MPKLSPARLILITFGGVALFYAWLAFLHRATVEGVADHLKILGFAAITMGWIWLWGVVCPRLATGSVGVRLLIAFFILVALTVVSGLLKQWLRHDAVWRELWDMPAVLFFLLVVQGLFSRANQAEKKA